MYTGRGCAHDARDCGDHDQTLACRRCTSTIHLCDYSHSGSCSPLLLSHSSQTIWFSMKRLSTAHTATCTTTHSTHIATHQPSLYVKGGRYIKAFMYKNRDSTAAYCLHVHRFFMCVRIKGSRSMKAFIYTNTVSAAYYAYVIHVHRFSMRT